MNEVIKRDVKKGELQYSDGIQNLQKKHMELLTELVHRPSLGKEIIDINVRKEALLNSDLVHTELDPPYKKTDKLSEEKTD